MNQPKEVTSILANRSVEHSTLSGWQIKTNQNQVIAWIQIAGEGPQDEVQTSLEIGCPISAQSATSIELIIHRAREIKSFDFDSFEGPYATNLKRKLADLTVGDHYWNTSVAGGWGGNGEADAFFFTIATFSKPDKTEEIAQMIAKGAQVIFAVHDGRDSKKVFRATFPAIDQLSEVAKTLNGCRTH